MCKFCTAHTAADGKSYRITKNYLDQPEIQQLNRTVSMYLDYAELQAARQKPMTRISHEVAQALALKEYEVFKKEQDRYFESDFDKHIKKLLNTEKERS